MKGFKRSWPDKETQVTSGAPTWSGISVELSEAYQNYEPPLNVLEVAVRLMEYVPLSCLPGLDRIVLTNVAALPRGMRKGKTRARKRQVPVAECAGLYHAKTAGRAAYIDIFVDNIWQYRNRAFRIIPFLRDLTLAEILYHEIGHHIHKTVRREYREPEDAADKWGRRLTFHFVRRRYLYLMPLLRLIKLITDTKWCQQRFRDLNLDRR